MCTGSVERGMITGASDKGYTVSSLDREGIETPELKSMNDTAYSVGDKVYFIFFRDGTGKILCSM